MLIFLYASEPSYTTDPNTIGTDVEFDGGNMASIDGFIKPGTKCMMLLPEVKN